MTNVRYPAYFIRYTLEGKDDPSWDGGNPNESIYLKDGTSEEEAKKRFEEVKEKMKEKGTNYIFLRLVLVDEKVVASERSLPEDWPERVG